MNNEDNNIINQSEPQLTPIEQPPVPAQPTPIEQPSTPVQPVQPTPIEQPSTPVQPVQPVQPTPIEQPPAPAQTEPQSTPVEQPQQIEPTPQNQPTENNDLLKSFIGDNYDKITTQKFNIPAFFLGSLYMFYRKMFLYGILFMIIELTITVILNKFVLIPILIQIVLAILTGLFINKIYISYANKKIAKIKDKEKENLSEKCSKKGGTSIGLAFLGGFIDAILIGLTIILIIAVLTASTVNKAGKIAEDKNKNEDFQGWLSYETKINLDDKLSITIPEKFKSTSEYKYHYEYSYESDSGVFDECEFELGAINNYTDHKKLINGLYKYNLNAEPKINSNKINNINWSWFSKIDENDSFSRGEYWYATSKDNIVYLIQYKIGKDADPDCEKYKDEIINSIKMK